MVRSGEVVSRRPAEVVSAHRVLEEVWDYDEYDTALVIRHISNLRRKLEEEPANPQRIVTVRGAGYRFG
jgi:DNA-binding response OmpR family regulator